MFELDVQTLHLFCFGHTVVLTFRFSGVESPLGRLEPATGQEVGRSPTDILEKKTPEPRLIERMVYGSMTSEGKTTTR